MIVRCNNCVSAFAVDDEKVADKKFAFTCPKCSTENIIDNRIIDKSQEENNIQLEESYFNDDFSVETDSSIKETDDFSTPDDLFSDEIPESGKNDDFSSIEDELASEFPLEDSADDSVKKDRNINLEIEETDDLPEIDDDIFAETPSSEKKDETDDLFSEIPSIDEINKTDDFISFDENETAKSSGDDFGLELKDDIAGSENDEIFFDDFDEKPVKKEPASDEESDFSFDDIDSDSASGDTKSEREKKLSSQDDIDALFAEEGIVFDEKPISKESELEFEDEITVDLDMLDIELEDNTESDKAERKSAASDSGDNIFDDFDSIEIDLDETSPDSDIFNEPVKSEKQKKEPETFEEDTTLDIDSLDIDLDETSLDSDIFSEPVKSEKQRKEPETFEEDTTLDIDNLDIDLDETSLDSDIFDGPVKAEKQKKQPERFEDDITLDIDNLDIDLDETSLDSDIFDEPVKAEKQTEKSKTFDDEITLDMDNLDIDFEESSLEDDIFEQPEVIKSSKAAAKKVEFSDDDFDEEEIKLNLDDLDIDIAEIEERELIFEDDEPAPVVKKRPKALIEETEEDESITIDLDTLEIEIAEENNVLSGALSEEDEKLTLDDAGLTFDELTSELEKSGFDESLEEDIRLTLDDIDPDLTLDKITRSASVETERIYDTIDELPEIDLDEYDAIVRQEENRVTAKSKDNFEDDLIIFPDTDDEMETIRKPDYDIFDYEESELEKSAPERGSTYFSIDLSLKYSRVGALLRLLGLYMISMIPHLIVMLIYTVLSSILGFINQIVILSTGRCVEDFALVIENTMRYFFYIKTNITGIIEDRPVYAGREHIDHPLQINITYPLTYSKNLAILRLSVIGILIITIPHLIIMSLITITIPFVYLAGIVSVIFTRRWPNVLFIYLTKYFRYMARITSFMTGLTDEYPPFHFD
ncbi:MAG: hypothetical protein CVV49_09950 [Spirochaetae bacterium HGW-Spirochaetae-5]|nr:MAG: hypothetical protein CVV49_09950 [Spirochaetae bacterium HGW-Spirochaetae-5]